MDLGIWSGCHCIRATKFGGRYCRGTPSSAGQLLYQLDMGRSRHLAQHVPMRTAWPTLNVMEPMSGDFGVLQSSTAVNIAKHDATFFDLYKRAIMEGDFSTIEWTQWANLCHIPITPWIENSAPVPAQTLLSQVRSAPQTRCATRYPNALERHQATGGFPGP